MLTDRFGRIHDYLRISLTDACNLRCTYCMPEHPVFAPKDKHLRADEIGRIAETFVKMGVRKIRLTGGEPLIRSDADRIIEDLGGLRQHGLRELTLTTNGIFLHEHIERFQVAGIRSVNVSLDTLLPERFSEITKRDQYHRVMSNIHLLLDRSIEVKVNMVVMKGVNDDEVTDFVALTRDYPLHVRFIEFMPFSGNRWQDRRLIRSSELYDRLRRQFEVTPLERKKHDTSKAFQVLGFAGTFAFISTMSEPFCGDCNRLRLTADGKIKNCLFSKGELDLLQPLRRGEPIEPVIHSALAVKEEKWGGQELFAATENRSMVSIGG
ncbi:MAG: 3,8-cyclase MoaA [Bacteroidota bacterium]